MSAVRSDGLELRAWRIALVPPAADAASATQAMQLVESMVWALKGTLRASWSVAPLEAADVVAVSGGTHDEALSDWSKRGKPIIFVSTSGAQAPDGTYVLIYPFRATQLIQLLNELDARLAAPVSAATIPDSNAPSGDTWSFIETLRTLHAVQNSGIWLTALQGQLPLLWLKGDGTEYSADPATLQDLRRGAFAFGALRMRQGTAPPAHVTLRPAAELEWFAGYHASADLAPWLDAKASFRITRWPNFGLIRPLPSQIRITALLSTSALTLEQLVRRSGMSRVEAVRTLNALEACNLLAATTSATSTSVVARAPVPQPPGGLSSFLRLIRKRLGLSKEA